MMSETSRQTLNQRLMALGLAIGVFELGRSSIFIYSFLPHFSHLYELALYPLVFAGAPWLISRALHTIGRGHETSLVSIAHTLLVGLAVSGSIPFLYERLLFLSPLLRIAVTLGVALGVLGGLWWWRIRLIRVHASRLFELSCGLVYCVTIDSDLSLSKLILQLPNASPSAALKICVKWGIIYAITIAWLTLMVRWSHRPRRLALLLSSLALGYGGLCVYQPHPHPRGEASLQDERGDVLLVIFDAMRGDARSFVREVDPQGGPLSAFDSLSKRALDFTEAHSGSLVTADSLPKLLDLRGHQLFLRLWPKKNYQRWAESLPGRMQSAGYEAHLLTDYPNQYLRGFDALDWDSVSSLRGRHLRLFNLPGDVWAALSGQRMAIKARRGSVSASTTEEPLLDQLQRILRRPRIRPRLIVLHLGTPHQPYAFPPYQPRNLPDSYHPEAENELFLSRFNGASSEEIQRFKRAYVYALRASDEALQRSLDLMETYGEPERDLIIVTSDHGEVFGDHGASRLAHGGHLYQASHHVPLLISGAGLKPEQISQPVSHTRVATTIYEVMRVKSPSQYTSQSPSLLQRGADEDASFTLRYRDRGGVAQLGPWRLIWSDRVKWLSRPDWAHRVPLELYHFINDPLEETNLISQRADVVLEMTRRLQLPLSESLLAPLKDQVKREAQ